MNVGALLEEDCQNDGEASSADEGCNDKNPVNISNTEDFIEDDPDWSPEGTRIAFTRHPVAGPHLDSFSAEMHVLNLETGTLEQVTDNDEEERGAAWSPDGRRIAYMCRRGNPLNAQLRPTTFEICVMDLEHRDPSGFPITTRLTSNTAFEGGPHWSPDGRKIVFGRMESPGVQQLWVMDLENLDLLGFPVATRLTFGPDTKLFANWGERRRAR